VRRSSPASASRVGHTFGRVAEAYERVRPEYPPAAVDHAVAALGLGSDARVLDLAAGTGKLTRSLEGRVGHVIAVEPDAAMRAYLGGDARPGTAEQIPVADGEVDAVFVGDAFVWFDPEPALAEIVRVLRPAGGLALLWNDWYQREVPPLPGEVRELLTDLYLRFRGRLAPAGDWRDDIARSPFGPLQHASFEVHSIVSGHDLAELELTRSSAAALEDGDRLGLAERIRPLMAAEYALTVVTSVDWTTLA
jgi:ubiquinone/menaquinone biosynthesis C-methylase UbiE